MTAIVWGGGDTLPLRYQISSPSSTIPPLHRDLQLLQHQFSKDGSEPDICMDDKTLSLSFS